MSYIDLFKHERVADVIGIPLYLALEDIDGEDFQCPKGKLVLGGGGGEHPGMTIKDINIGAKLMLYFDYNLEQFRDLAWEDIGFDYKDWSIPICHSFYELALTYGYSEDDGYFDYWLFDQITKAVIENRPELIDNELLELMNTNERKVEE